MIHLCWFLILLNVTVFIRYFFMDKDERKAFMLLIIERGVNGSEEIADGRYWEDARGCRVRCFYALKGIVALLLGRQKPRGVDEYFDWVEVCYFNFYRYTSMDWWGPCANFTYLAVPRGWRGWYYEIDWDGYP